ncbi:MAG: hypothetical protein ABR502_10400 [Chitinophagaceae bacterium]
MFGDCVSVINLQSKFPTGGQGAMRYTQTTLNKLEAVVEETGYIIRFERGTFQSGYCILEDKKVVVLNKFLQLEGKINTLIDLIPQLQIDANALTPESRKVFDDIMGKQHEGG